LPLLPGMHCTVICDPSGYVIFLYIISNNGPIYVKKLLNTKWLFQFSLQRLSETFLILRRIEQYIVVNVNRSSYNVPIFISDYNEPWIVSIDFRKIHKYRILWKFVKWESNSSMRKDRPAEGHDEANLSCFSQMFKNSYKLNYKYPFKNVAQAALFKAPVRTAQ
jgi:hypothetical protein